MSSMVRLCFLKYPLTRINLNEPFDFSLTVCNDLGLNCGIDVEDFNIQFQLRPSLAPPSSNQSKQIVLNKDLKIKNKRLENLLNLQIIEPKIPKGPNQSNLVKIIQVKGGLGYLMYNFKLIISGEEGLDLEWPLLELVIEAKGIDASKDVIFPGGNLVEGVYFQSLYTFAVKLTSSKLGKSNKTISKVLNFVDEDQLVGSLRYFNFLEKNLPTSLINHPMKVVELPFGKDLGSHCWDCSWIGLDFFTKLIFNLSNHLEEIDQSHFELFPGLKSLDLVKKLREVLLPKQDKKEVSILELGCGCGLLGQGMARALSSYWDSLNSTHSTKTNKKNPPKYQIILSDTADVLPSTQRNLLANFLMQPNPKSNICHKLDLNVRLDLLTLDWTEPIPSTLLPSSPDLIIAFDVVYNDAAHKPLTTVLNNLSKLARAKGMALPWILLGYKQRSRRVEQGFFEMIRVDFTIQPLLTFAGLHLLVLRPIEVNFI